MGRGGLLGHPSDVTARAQSCNASETISKSEDVENAPCTQRADPSFSHS